MLTIIGIIVLAVAGILIYATMQPTSRASLEANLLALNGKPGTHPLLMESGLSALANLQPTPQDGTVFTDDLAPIEWITNSMVLDFFLSGEVEQLQ